MAETLNLKQGKQYLPYYRAVEREIKDRVEGCLQPRCWELKDPKDNGQIYLDKRVSFTGGQLVQIRRYLFWDAYKQLPARRKLIMKCKNIRCCNPAHATYKGFDPPYTKIEAMLELNWITEAEVKRWWG